MREWTGALAIVVMMAGCQVQLGSREDGTAGGSGSSGGAGNSAASEAERTAAINQKVIQAGKFEVQAERAPQEISCQGGCPKDGQEGNLFCTYQRYEETRVFGELVAFEPNSSTLWPGAVVVGKDARQGLLTPVGLKLAPVTFSVSLENLSGSPSATMDTPSLSSFREEMLDVLKGAAQATAPARVAYEEARIDSQEQLELELGFGVGYKSFGAKGAFNFSSGSKRTKLVANFVQSYYTVDVDTPQSPADFFAPGVTASDLTNFIGADNPPLYIQSITYGRRAFFFLETDATYTEIKTSLEASFSAILAKAEANLSSEHRQRLESSNMKVIFLGGSGASAVKAISGYDGFRQALLDGANYSPESPGAPIAYKLAYLDNTAAAFNLTSDYSVRSCTPTQGKLTATLQQIVPLTSDGTGASEYYGEIGVTYPSGNGDGGCDDPTAGYLSLMSNGEGQSWSEGSDYSEFVENVPLGADKKACLYVKLYEDDAFVDDEFGVVAKEVPLQSGFFKLPVSGSDEKAEVWIMLNVE
ncbi:MAG: thiol-activated cytolysin family protein [Polyangiaceae bacterium]|jgi:thiol-activated cytolysin|nr:thiol-activated cytolysin family protein [Polyangiaceae bacterium]